MAPVKRTLEYPFLVLTVLSAFYAFALFFSTSGIYAGDSESYMWTARFFSGQTPLYGFAHRTFGYPLLMAVCGVVYAQTFLVLFIVQAFMGVCVPLFIYKTARLVLPKASFFCGLFAVVSMLPYLHAKYVLTEQFYMVTLFALIYFSVRFLKGREIKIFWAVILCLVILNTIRPSAKYLFAGILPVFFFLQPGRWRHFFFGGLLILAMAQAMYFPNRFRQGDFISTSVIGQAWFYPVYLASGLSVHSRAPFARENGPATRQLMDAVDEYFEKNGPLKWEEWGAVPGTLEYGYLFGRYDGRPEQIKEAFFKDPVYSYRAILEFIISRMFPDAKDAEKLYLGVISERLKRDPFFALRYTLRHLRAYFFSLSGDYSNHISPPERWKETGIVSQAKDMTGEKLFSRVGGFNDGMNQIPAAMESEILAKPASDVLEELTAFLGRFIDYAVVRPITAALMFLTLPFVILDSRTRFFGLILFWVVFYGALTICLFQVPLFRYIVHTFLIESTLAITGLFVLTGHIRFRSTRGPGLKSKEKLPCVESPAS